MARPGEAWHGRARQGKARDEGATPEPGAYLRLSAVAEPLSVKERTANGVVPLEKDPRQALIAWAHVVSDSMVARNTRAVEAAFPTLASAINPDGPLTEGVVLELHRLAIHLVSTPIPWQVEGYSNLLRKRIRELLAEMPPNERTSTTP